MYWMLLACRPPESDAITAGPGVPPVSGAEASLHAEYASLVYVRWEQLDTSDTWVEYQFAGEDWRATPVRERAPGPQEALLLGVPYDEEVRWRLVADQGQGAVYGEEGTLRTGAHPEGLPRVNVVSGDPDRWEPTLNHLLLSLTERPGEGDYGLFMPWWVMVIDRQGRVVWARRTDPHAASLHPRVAWDGRSILLDESTFWGSFDEGRGSVVRRMYLDGTEAEVYPTPGLHHPFTDTPDGALLWNAYADGDETIEELAADGARRSIWKCGDYTATVGETEECGSNTLSWHEASGRLLFSAYTLYTVFEVERDSGETVRTYGQLAGSWTMDPARAEFWMQHGVHYTEAGTLIASTWQGRTGGSTVVREYVVDEPAATLREVWNMGVGDGVYGEFMGEPWRLPGGNTLHNTGSLPRVREGTPEGDIVWDVDWSERAGSPDDAWLGRSTPIEDLYALLPEG